jgi:protoporphyrinogen oxidase
METKKHSGLVIGGGVSGLFAANRLQAHGFAVTMVEECDSPGGLLTSIPVGSVDLELYYHHLFRDDALLLDACHELGIPLHWTATRTGFIGPGSSLIHELSAPQDLVRFRYLSVPERLSLAVLLARVKLILVGSGGDVSGFDETGMDAWFGALGSRRLYRRFFMPMILQKWGGRSSEISAAWLMGRLGMRSGRTRQGELLGYPEGGFQRLVDALVRRVRDGGGEVLTGTTARSVQISDGRVSAVHTSRGELKADVVISTLAPAAQTALLEASGLCQDAQRFARIPYQAALTVLLGVQQGLSEFYWVNILDRSVPFGAVVEHTRLRPEAEYGGPVVYLASYPDPDSDLWHMEDRDVVRRFACHMEHLFPGFGPHRIRWSRVARTAQASPIYVRGFRSLIPPYRGQVPGMYYTGMFRCYPKRPINLVAAHACRCADLAVLDHLHGCAGTPESDHSLPVSFAP